ncbi:DUF3238 domain-containing protein [Paenibacillus sp. 1001270B_150601_E10]|uniref:DUF3238 domain-containing protein n=1 Tax=Paenibacillus sp. 1001270B_150601_E10 TaxID=2787079 RepID=UPI00189EAB46|nr:DUF3238 domain-containing protein [Paenibacillus sp. 1001270B_150601_E10]
MAELVKIRASVFIGHILWLEPVFDPKQQAMISYQGDARGFHPNTAHTGRSRVEQEVTVDFVKRRIVAYADTGTTVMKKTIDGTVSYEQGKASPDTVQVLHETWTNDQVSFLMRASARNPLRAEAPPVDYEVQVTVYPDGNVTLKGAHDGFPCFEFYKQIDFGDFETLYQHDYAATGNTPAAMAGDMEYSFELTK